MGIKRRLGRLLGFTADETPPRPIADVLLEMAGRGILPRAGRNEALSVPAVLRARNLICSSPASLPLIQRDAQRNVVRLPLLEQIDPNVPNVVTLSQTLEDLLFEGVSWWRVLARGADDYPTYAEHLDYTSVRVQPPSNNDGRQPAPLPGGYDPRRAAIYVYGQLVTDPARVLIRFDSPNPGLLTAGGRSVRRALLLDTTSALYADNPRPMDYFTPTEDADPASDEELAQILLDWKLARKTRSTAYVPASMKYNAVDTPTPADLQLIELQRKATLDIANATGLDPEDLGVSTTSRTYQNGVDRRQDRINDTYAPYMQAVSQRLSMGDITRRGYMVAFDLDEYLRADPKTRAEVYQRGIEDGWLTADEVREEEGRPALTAAQKVELKPPAPAPAQPLPSNVHPIRPTAAAMAADDGDGLTFDMAIQPLAHVDTERRIIEGIVVPYGPTKVAWKGGQRWRFQQGSLIVPAELHRNKALRDHDNSQPLGKLVFAEDRPEGMFARYKIIEGPDGDRALAEADDQIRDGWSVGVEILDAQPDPLNQGVYLVSLAGATWRESSLLAVPAFDDARVTRVAAGADKGEPMKKCPTCGADLTEGVAHVCETAPPPAETPPVQLSNDQLKGLLAQPELLRAIMGVPAPAAPQPEAAQFGLTSVQVAALLAAPGGREALLGLPAPERPIPVDPTRNFGNSVTVNEEQPYRFDRKGNLTAGRFDFSTDVISGLKDHDAEALKRAEKFVADSWVAFDTKTTDATSLNYPVNHPEMYVDQKEFQYPIWSTIDKGTLANITPFVLPKFNTSSGMVAAHSEGVEPSLGTFTATAQTITPSAVSGKVSISREAWDQGGNPQLSGLIWRQMTRAWYEALEAAAVALLEAAAPTTITVPTASQDDTLVSYIETSLAGLQFVRGGFRMREFFGQVDFYQALVGATDADGRKMLPILGPTNAAGATQERYGSVRVGGQDVRPAWALAATSTNSANSYLFDRNDVSGWATAPTRLQFENVEVRYVHVGIWGYKALAITDITGVRRFAYDPQ